MSQHDLASQAGAEQLPPGEPAYAGDILRSAREAAGLSIDEVAGQLKLAPKQVVALEEHDFTHLPGRTFVRGFARNYARLLQLDPQAVIDALPGGNVAGGLESPALHATTVSIGELPSDAKARAAWLGWLLLAAIIAVAAYMGWQYFQGQRARGAASPGSGPLPPTASAPATGTSAAPSGSSAAGSGAAPPTPVLNAAPAVANLDEHGAAPADPNAATGVATPSSAAAALTVAVRTSSWVEIKDSTGKAVLSETMGPGQSQAVSGTPPFDVVIGNAPDVTLTLRGQPVDLAPHTRANVARFKLQ